MSRGLGDVYKRQDMYLKLFSGNPMAQHNMMAAFSNIFPGAHTAQQQAMGQQQQQGQGQQGPGQQEDK